MREETVPPSSASKPRRRNLGRARTLALLEELGAAAGLTVSVAPGTSADIISNRLKEVPADNATRTELADTVKSSKTGAVIYWGGERRYLILPPFPVTATTIEPALNTQPLRDTLVRDYLIGFVLVRLGAYAIGVSRGENLLTSKVGTGNVHGRHKKGGSSAHRFERHRDKQIEYFMTRLCQRAREHLEPFVNSLDYLVYGGAWTTIALLQKQCEFLGRLKTTELPPRLDIPEPRQAVLKSAVKTAWSSTVYEWPVD